MIAEVNVNSQKLRVLWCKPFALDIAGALKEGENTLQVKVTSTWFNRLAFDASLPEDKRKTWTIGGPEAGVPLKNYGLLGPVTLNYLSSATANMISFLYVHTFRYLIYGLSSRGSMIRNPKVFIF